MIKTLIVDDNAGFRQSFAVHLYQHFPGMIVAEAADAAEAVEKATTVHPHLVIIDIQLPGESGLELTRKIKSARPDVLIAILTAYDLPEYRQAAQEYGADYFFSKSSSSMEELVAVIDSAATRRE
jgi:DNA-binding NarL/FixJ family response regulator